ncbi:MAG: HigA family addiction module antidote protein [Desulfobacterales bacterium]|nr:HigA family addiction module antidote protein [Desulfobacterales bacterium]
MRDFPPIHPGEILLEEFMKPMGISMHRLAEETGLPANRIAEICGGQTGLSKDIALRLSRFFGTSVEFWMGIQSHYVTEKAEAASSDGWEK